MSDEYKLSLTPTATVEQMNKAIMDFGSDDLIKRLEEPIVADAFNDGRIQSGLLAERLVKERVEAAMDLREAATALAEAQATIARQPAMLDRALEDNGGLMAENARLRDQIGDWIARAEHEGDGEPYLERHGVGVYSPHNIKAGRVYTFGPDGKLREGEG